MTTTLRTYFRISRSLHLRPLALAAALAAPMAWAAPTVAFNGPALVMSGSSFQLDVSASELVDLYAYQFDIRFDPALFQATGVAPGGFLATAGTTFFDPGVVDNAAGTVTFVLESLIGPGAGATGSGNLAQVNFTATGAGSTAGAFGLANFAAFDSALAPMDVALRGATVAIPEPSSLALALAALGIGCVGGRTRARQRADGAPARV